MVEREMVCYRGPKLQKHAPDCSGTDCSGSQLTIKRFPANYRCRPTRNPMLYLSPPTIDCFLTQQRWFYPKPCVCNVLNALEMRVGKCTRKPDEKYIIKNLSPLVDTLASHCQAGPCKYEEVYAHYSGAKRAQIGRAHV